LELEAVSVENNIYDKFPQIKNIVSKRLSYKDLELRIIETNMDLPQAAMDQLIVALHPFTDKSFGDFYEELHSFRLQYYGNNYKKFAVLKRVL